MFEKLRKLLQHSELSPANIDGLSRIEIHKKILNQKPILQDLFIKRNELFYKLDNENFDSNGLKVEIGAGVTMMKGQFNDVLSSDIVPHKDLDMVIDAEKIKFSNKTVRSYYLQNSLHHIPSATKFFNEVERTLKIGGGLIILEPYYGFFARLLYTNIFKTEGFDCLQKEWEQNGIGVMNGANQALSYIIFKRDIIKFNKKYPNLIITRKVLCNDWLVYIMSGGLNFKQLFPSNFIFILKSIQYILKPLLPIVAIHHIIVIKKIR